MKEPKHEGHPEAPMLWADGEETMSKDDFFQSMADGIVQEIVNNPQIDFVDAANRYLKRNGLPFTATGDENALHVTQDKFDS